MKMMSKIKLITHPYPIETLQARIDEAILTGRPMIERPYYYTNIETGQDYYDLCGCIGWPSVQKKEQDDKDARPGYIAVVGVVRLKNDALNPEDAVFQLLDEDQDKDVPSLIEKWLVMREKWGFGLTPELLTTLFGDPDRFIATLAMFNERLIKKGGEKAAMLIAPPHDFYDTLRFDIYLRSLRSVFVPKPMYSCLSQTRTEPMPRFYHGGCEILKTRLREFTRDDPVVTAMGGLVHSLLMRMLWLDQSRENAFSVEESYVLHSGLP